MSDHTSASLAAIDNLIPALASLPAEAHRDQLVEESEALRKAIAAFHMEAIRFRMYSVDRLLIRQADADCSRLFGEVRSALETAGFHTRSHAAP